MKQHRLLWTEEWTTGIAWLDDEHRELIDYYHAVVDALREDGEDHAFPERLNDLREWLSRHFQSEESALQKIGCEEVYQHKKEHRQFIRTLDDFKNNSQKIYAYRDRSAVTKYIFYWLMRHGEAYDAKIPSHLQNERQ